MFISVCIPIITEFIKWILKYIRDTIPVVIAYFRNYGSQKKNKITITSSKTYSNKQSHWVVDPCEAYNYTVIDALLHYIKVNSLYSNDMKCQVSSSGGFNMRNQICTNQKTEYDVGIYPNKVVNDGMFTFQIEDSTIQTDTGSRVIKKVIVSSDYDPDVITDFITKQHGLYQSRNNTDHDGQYFYKLAGGMGTSYKKYFINNKTTFDTIFFPQKEKILQMLTKLRNNKIPKLTMLLHGDVGLGKTSIIKALAHELGYAVIEVKLSMIKSDNQLVNIFHEPNLQYHDMNDTSGDKKHTFVPLDRRIYIFEDIDAESDVVFQREPEPKDDADEIDGAMMNAFMSAGEGYHILPTRKVAVSEKKSDISAITTIADAITESKKDTDDKPPPLTLSGILNVLDGLLELNGAVIVMTTNYPEKLDSALIRPGRITMNIEMKRMLASDSEKLIRHHFPDDTFDIMPVDYAITPAQLESFCQIANSANELQQLFVTEKINHHSI